MLDKGASAQQVRERLATAFTAWEQKAPKANTKAQFARECAAASGRACTPQTVGGWFKTGRMDKMWIPVVEQVLGASLGFSGIDARESGESPWPFKRVTPAQFYSLSPEVHALAEAVILQALASGGTRPAAEKKKRAVGGA